MSEVEDSVPQSRGFALLVVLTSLAVLTTLFAISSKNNLSDLEQNKTEVSLMQAHFRNVEILRAAIREVELPESSGPWVQSVNIGAETLDILFWDIGGLVDLNTASPNLLAALFDAWGADEQSQAAFWKWRQTQNRVMRVEDVLRLLGEVEPDLNELLQTVTVFSGRAGVSSLDRSAALEERLKARDLDAFDTPATQNRFLVLEPTDGVHRVVGTINLAVSPANILTVQPN